MLGRPTSGSAESHGPGQGPAGAREARHRMSSPRVLLVDDDERILATLGNNLHQLGCSVRTANRGEQALDLLERDEYALALVDAVMPGIDGLSLAARMRQRWPRMRVVVFSGKARTEMVTEAFRLGVDDFLSKPIDGEQLKHLVQRFAWPSQPFRVSPGPLEQSRAAGERAGILVALQAADWNRRAAAAILQISYSTLMRKMRKLGIHEHER